MCGGGRYDGLIEQLGGKPAPGVGWGLGMERLLFLLEEVGVAPPAAVPDAYAVVPSADALATALFVLGPERGLAFAEDRRIAAYFIVRNANGTFETRSSAAFMALGGSLA